MQVFKNYFKILRSSRLTMLIYMGIFLMLALLIAVSNKDQSESRFEQSKANISIINRDDETGLIKALEKYLSNYCTFIDIEDDNEKLMDAIFFRQITYALIIPEDFTENFSSGADVKLEKITSLNDISVDYTQMAIDNFISTAEVFYKNPGNLSEDEIVDAISESLSVNVDVSLNTNAETNTDYAFLATYLNNFVYIFIAIFIIGVSIVMSSYNNLDVKRRNLVSPISIKKINLQLFLGNMVYTTVSALILITLGFLIAGETIFNIHGILFIINSLIFSLCALSISFFIAQFPLKREAVVAISNVVSLGLAFICGAFVPLELIGENIIRIAKFTPSYWFIAANDLIARTPEISNDFIKTILGHMGIQLLFTIALFTLSLAVTKAGRAKEA